MTNNTRLGERSGGTKQQFGYVETDPSGRYGRFREILGKGAMKTVYKAFDEVLGMEVAWNQVKLNDVFHSPDELQRLYSEVHLLKNLDHDFIIRFHTSWIDLDGRTTFNFITEMFTSGTLREYRQKYKRVHIGVIKNWARQILHGLAHLHGRDPPVIHRDLKCDNIFVNGHLGQVKIGDLGLAAILRGSQHAHSVIGTPEFMAPELYEEDYDELVDVYSFGMCVLEMLTSEYPYSECSNPAQIYKKVTSGKLPEAFYRIEDVEAREFVGKCLQPVANRPPAKQLLMDPFLAADNGGKMLPMPSPNGTVEKTPSFQINPRKRTTDMTITGTINPEDDTIFLKVKISDKDGVSRNIYFPFDIGSDTAIDVATEMVKELEITDWEPFEIAKMIEEEILALVPSWKEWTSPENHQHTFLYEEEDDDDSDDNENYHPFCSYASQSSSSRGSVQDHSISREITPHQWNHMIPAEDWFQEPQWSDLVYAEGLLINDDTSSQSSLNSEKYAGLVYCSIAEDDIGHPDTKRGEPIFTTRFCPEEGTSSWNLGNGLDSGRPYKPNSRRKLNRIKSFVDVRSQLLRRSLMEVINKRRLFKTIGAVENIGYQEPGEFPKEIMSMNGEFSGNSSPRNSEMQRFKR